MSVRPFDRAALPRLKGADLEAARRAAVRFGDGPRVAELTVGRFGRVSLTFARVRPTARPAADEMSWSLRRSDAQGWLVHGHAAGLRIVSTMLGLPSPSVHRPPGTTERGVLAAAISAIVRLAPGLTLAAARNDAWSGRGLARIEGHAESETFREAFFLDVPPAWIPTLPDDTARERWRRPELPITVSVELARTAITAAEWSRARTGDAVVFDDPRGAATGPHPVRIVCGDFAAPATPVDPGTLRLTGGFAPRPPQERSPMANDPDRDITTTVLAAAPIQVVAELGRLTLRADEVAALQAGSILALPARAEARVELRVADRPWARGELVDVDGQLAVRLTSVVAPAGPADADTVRG